VIGSCRSPDKAERLRGLGAEPIVLDALDARTVRETVSRAAPDAIVHEATALADRAVKSAMAYLDQAVTDAGGIALRYGGVDPSDVMR